MTSFFSRFQALVNVTFLGKFGSSTERHLAKLNTQLIGFFYMLSIFSPYTSAHNGFFVWRYSFSSIARFSTLTLANRYLRIVIHQVTRLPAVWTR